jgi:hypothetical protein
MNDGMNGGMNGRLPRELRQFSSKQRAGAIGGWQFRLVRLPLRANKAGNSGLDVGHTRPAVPTGREVRLNLCRAAGSKFAIHCLKQFLVRNVQLISQHQLTARPRG